MTGLHPEPASLWNGHSCVYAVLGPSKQTLLESSCIFCSCSGVRASLCQLLWAHWLWWRPVQGCLSLF